MIQPQRSKTRQPLAGKALSAQKNTLYKLCTKYNLTYIRISESKKINLKNFY